MFSELKLAVCNKSIKKGKDWIRIVPKEKEETLPIGYIDNFHSNIDILDMLLEKYLSDRMADPKFAKQIRLFFLFDSGTIPYLA